MLKTIALLTMLGGLAAAQTYSFDPGVTCIAARIGWDGWQLRSCSTTGDNNGLPIVSLPNPDGTKAAFKISQGYQNGWKAVAIDITVTDGTGIVFFSETIPVTVPNIYLPNGGPLTFQIESAAANGSFTFQITGCQGARGMFFCGLSSVGSPSGTLTVTQ